MSIGDLINRSVKCTICGTQGVGNCSCWVKCGKCGCSFEKGQSCNRCENPNGPLKVMAFGKVKL